MNARKVAQIVDRCIGDVLAGHVTLEECIARHPKLADELKTVLPVAVLIRSVQHPAMPPQAKQAGLYKLLSATPAPGQSRARPRSLQRIAVPRRPLSQRWLQRAAAMAALVLTLSVGSVGVALAAESSLPGDILYPVKTAREQLWLHFTPSDRQAALHLTLAERRLAEIEALAAQGEEVPLSVVEALQTETMIVAAEVISGTDTDLALAQRLADLATATHPVLLRVAASAPPAAQAGLARALAASEHALTVAIEVLGGLPPGLDEEHGPPEQPPGQDEEQGPPEQPPGQDEEQGPPEQPPGQDEGQGPPEQPPGQDERQ
nr:hypothetical protein [Anaerolineae bacterium]